jgi:hypothetical protein
LSELDCRFLSCPRKMTEILYLYKNIFCEKFTKFEKISHLVLKLLKFEMSNLSESFFK